MPPASREKQLSAWLLTIAGNVFVEDDTRGGRRYVARRSYQLSRAATRRSGRLAAQGNAQPLSLVAAFRQRCLRYLHARNRCGFRGRLVCIAWKWEPQVRAQATLAP